MEDFEITVTGITSEEYFQACRQNNRRMYSLLAVAMVVICGVIILAAGSAGPAAFLGPLAVYVIFVVAVELISRFSYKGQLAQVDPVVYGFDDQGWDVTAGGQTVDIDWSGTVKMEKTRDCIFLYHDRASSSLLPKRLMSDAQMQQLEIWYRESRKASKKREKEETEKEREKFRSEHQNLKFGNRGPSWGPWKRK